MCYFQGPQFLFPLGVILSAPLDHHTSSRGFILNCTPASANRPPPDLASPSCFSPLTLFPSPSHSACTPATGRRRDRCFLPSEQQLWIKSNGILHLLCLCLLQRQSCFHLILINPNKYFLFSSNE